MKISKRISTKVSKFLLAKVALIGLFTIVTVLQVFSFPGQFAHMGRINGWKLILEVALTLLVALLFLCAQVAIFSLWKLISYMQLGSFYSYNSIKWMNRFVISVRTATVFPILLILIIAPQADDPGVLVFLLAISFFIGSFYLVSLLLRDQIQMKAAALN
ncbi:MAG: hypothetical protein RL540_397 [Actinomycetota bacterium]|jgi:hypothetical protein